MRANVSISGETLRDAKIVTNVPYASSAYRHDIEGLRALAVTPVILYHAHMFCPGGFVGVDVFFVISGYLITKIIQREFEHGRFTLMSFYQRRIRRIFPALFVLFAISSAFACVLLLPDELRTYGRSLMASVAFASNIFFRSKIDYFDATSEDQPLLHIWSLAVEEQFYIFWPLILVAMNIYVTEKTKTLTLVTILVVSLVYGEFLVHYSPEAAFYMMPSRAWELLLGALMATSSVSNCLARMPRRAADLASIVGVLLISFAIVAYDSNTPFPGLAGLAPCVGAALVIAAGEFGPTLGGRLLSLSPFAFIGRISYSLYLWHWPILVFAHLYLGRDLHLDEKCWLIPLIVVAACMSWRFVEEPFRNFLVAASDGRAWLTGGVAAGFVVASAGAVIVFCDGFPNRVQARTREIVRVRAEAEAFQLSPCLARRASLPPIEGCLLGQASRDANYDVILWGDSQAAQLAPALATLGQRIGFTAREITKAGCAPLPGVRFFPEHELRLECPDFNKAAMDAILNHSPGTIILAGWWDEYATGGLLVAAGSTQPSVAQSRQEFIATVKDTVHALTSAGHHVIVVAQAPIPNGNPIDCIERARLIGRSVSNCAVTGAVFAEADSRVKNVLRSALETEPDAQLVFPFEHLCDAQECRIFTEQGNFVYLDAAHLSAAGAELVGVSLKAALTDSRRLHEAATR
jgi:peptidoglycan/LPS O-acetylase OafA/YrhL